MESFISKEIKSDEFLDGCMSLDSESKCFYMTIVEQSLKRLSTNPTDLLVKLIPKVKTISDLGFILLCLNNGADVNSYVSTESGNFHIIVYGLMFIKEDFYKLFTMMMIFKGSNPLNKAMEMLDDTESESVKEWCISYRGFKMPSTSSKAHKYIKKLEEDEQIILNIMFNLEDTYHKTNMILVCCFRSPIFNKITDNVNNKAAIKLFFKCGLKKLFLQVLNNNIEVQYSDVCYFISQYSNIYKIPELQPICEIYKELFRIIALRGVEFDCLQLEELEHIDIPFKMELEEICKSPIWEKIEHNSKGGKIKEEYYDYGFLLGLNRTEDPKVLSSFFVNIASSDSSVLINSLRKRHISKIALETTNIFDKVSTHVHVESTGKDPFDYPDMFIFYYKDKEDKIWSFFYNNFTSIIKSGKNPYNNEQLSEHTINLLKNKYKYLSFLSINNVLSYSDIIKIIKEPCIIKINNYNELIRRYSSTLESKGYNKESLCSISIDILRSRLEEVDIFLEMYIAIGNMTKMSELNITDKFIYSIFIQAISDKIIEDPSILNKLRSL